MAFAAILNSPPVKRIWRRPAPGERSLGTTVALGLLATVIYLAGLELGMRAASGTPLFGFSDLRLQGGARQDLNAALVYDPTLGWRHKPGIRSKEMNTLEYGFRSNGDLDAPVQKGGVLAVGSSFTAGSEVEDRFSWPAQLEDMAGINVNNAGVGNYSADQIILHAEHLLPVVEPDVIVVDLLADNILGAGYSSYAWPKPYFTIDDGGLVHHNAPVPKVDTEKKGQTDYKSVMAASVVADRFFSVFFPDFWKTSGQSSFEKSGADEVDVTCRLLERLKRKTEAADTRLILYLQFAGSHIVKAPEEPAHTQLVRDCAQNAGIQTVDEYGELRSVHDDDLTEFRTFYMIQPDGSTGHKSPLGNRHVAERVFSAMNAQPPSARDRQAADGEIANHGDRPLVNLVPRSENLGAAVQSTPHARFEPEFNFWLGDQSYLIEARGPLGDHYVTVPVPELGAGPLTLTAEIRPGRTERIRFQLRKAGAGGILSNVDLRRDVCTTLRLGSANNARCGVEPASGGWHRVWMSASLPGGTDEAGTIFLQLADKEGRVSFVPSDESVSLRRLQVVPGYRPVAYMASGD